jgi:hypothetical protein
MTMSDIAIMTVIGSVKILLPYLLLDRQIHGRHGDGTGQTKEKMLKERI